MADIMDAWQETFRKARNGQLAPGTVKIRLDGGRNSGAEGWLTGETQTHRTGNVRLQADLEGIGLRWVSLFDVIEDTTAQGTD